MAFIQIPEHSTVRATVEVGDGIIYGGQITLYDIGNVPIENIPLTGDALTAPVDISLVVHNLQVGSIAAVVRRATGDGSWKAILKVTSTPAQGDPVAASDPAEDDTTTPAQGDPVAASDPAEDDTTYLVMDVQFEVVS